VIKDFHVGTDQLWLVDVIDAYDARMATGQDWNVNPHATRYAGIPGDGDVYTTERSDYNLTFRDFVQADSANQYLTLSDDGNGWVKIDFRGHGGVSLGSVVLEGVAYEATPVANNGRYGSVQELMGNGFNDPAVAAAPLEHRILYATADGFHPQLMI
jgi:hypothetical protein